MILCVAENFDNEFHMPMPDGLIIIIMLKFLKLAYIYI